MDYLVSISDTDDYTLPAAVKVPAARIPDLAEAIAAEVGDGGEIPTTGEPGVDTLGVVAPPHGGDGYVAARLSGNTDRQDAALHGLGVWGSAVGITFLFANLFHPSMRFAAPTRRELGIATAFNVLGPLTNPGRPHASAIGVSSARHAPLVAGVLAERGNSALVFRGSNGLDELTSTSLNEVWVVDGGSVRREEIDATRLGIAPSTVEDLRGADAAHNADVAREVLAGGHGIIADTVALNAAAGLVAHGVDGTREGSLEDRLAAGLELARESLSSGRARAVLDRWVVFSTAAG